MIYLEEINRMLNEGTPKESFDLDYKEGSGQLRSWINSWKIRVVDSKTALDNTIKVIQEAKNGRKIGAMYLKPKQIYIGKYTYDGTDYPIAIYNSGTVEVMNELFTKVEVTAYADLKNEDNEKKIFVQETAISYFIVSFYEEGKESPTVFMQVEKFPFSDLMSNSMEEWLKFLRILVEEQEDAGNELPDVSLVEKVTFYPYDASDPKGCFRRSTEMLESSGFTPAASTDTTVIQMTKYDSNGNLAVQEGSENGLDLINIHLDAGKPIVVGVDYVAGHAGNTDKTTDHWVIIVARKTVNGSVCYQYFDPQTSQPSIGTSTENLLCLQSNGTLTGRYRKDSPYDRTYTVTMVRPSINK